MIVVLALWLAPALGCDDGEAGRPDASGGADASEPVPLPPAPADWHRHAIDRDAYGPAFTSAGDLDGDGRIDLVTGQFGHVESSTPPPGRVVVHLQGQGLDSWTRVEVMPSNPEVPFPNHPSLADVDRDGDLDIVMPSGFLVCTLFYRQCGAIIWYENAADGWTAHEIVAPGDRLFYHSALLVDFDGDDVLDLVTVGEHFSSETSEAHAMWFRGTDAPQRFESEPRTIGEGGGSLPSVLDIDGDGDLDVASAEFFVEGESAVWFERTADPSPAQPAGVFVRHVIEDRHGPAIQLSFVRDLFGENRLWAILSNHTSIHRGEPASGVFLYEVPTDDDVRERWRGTLISEGIVSDPDEGIAREAAPGIFHWGDIDGDGDIDILLSGDGDPDVYWLEQTAEREFVTHVLQQDLPQAGSTIVSDLDGDGANELLVSGYEHDALLLYTTR